MSRRLQQRRAGGPGTHALDSPPVAGLDPEPPEPARNLMKTRSAPTGLTKKKSTGGVVDTVKTVVYAILIALVVRTVAYEPFNIPSGSMVPTLLVGDYLFVSKYSYGYSARSIGLGFIEDWFNIPLPK